MLMTTDERVILERIEGKLEAHAKQLDNHVREEVEWQTEIGKKLVTLDGFIRGNGVPGIHIRLDRIEQLERGRAKLLWIAMAAAVSALATVVRGWLVK
jgi:hypothetical protein